MAYTLQAIIIPGAARDHAAERGWPYVDLNARGFWLLPLPYQKLAELGWPYLPLAKTRAPDIGESLDELCRFVSRGTQSAYVEAHDAGGDAIQACLLYQQGALVAGPLLDAQAINRALRWLGVRCHGGQDEFGAAGLDQHRSTADWLDDYHPAEGGPAEALEFTLRKARPPRPDRSA